MVLMRALAAMSAVAVMAVTAVGCSSGLSKEDADLRCDQDKLALGSFFSDKIYAECEACYMECGDQCVRSTNSGTSPLSYACADESSTSTSSSSSSSSSSGQ